MAPNSERLLKPPASLASIAAGILGVAALAASSRAQEPSVFTAPHGAAPSDLQERRLDELLGANGASLPPRGIDPAVFLQSIPADNEPTPERIALGRRLYFDPALSADGSVSCATCHDVLRGFTDQRMVSEGIRGQLGRRNAPTTMNTALLDTLFWDGRAGSLEEQARLPIINPIEMGQPSGEAAVKAIAGDETYRRQFLDAYGRGPNYEDIGRAIASFERTLNFLDAPIDRFLAGDEGAISASARRGWDLFQGKARCVSCHPMSLGNPLGTDLQFHNIGVSARHQDFEALARRALRELARDDSPEALDRLALETDLSELGRFTVTRDYADIGAFRTPMLRNVGLTAPYMHDGSMHTLFDVMDHYNKGGEANPYLDGGIEPLALTEAEIDDLVALMFAFTDVRFADENARAFEAQRRRAAEHRPFRDDDLAHRLRDGFEDRLGGN